MLRNVEFLFFLAAVASVYPAANLAGGESKLSKWWITMPFVFLSSYAVCAFLDGKLSLIFLVGTGVVCFVASFGMMHLCNLVNSLRITKIDPNKPIVLPLPK